MAIAFANSDASDRWDSATELSSEGPGWVEGWTAREQQLVQHGRCSVEDWLGAIELE